MMYVILLGLADRIRGSGWFPHNHFVGQILMGLVTAHILASSQLQAIYIVLAVAIGSAPGWGEPLGAAFDCRRMNPDRYEWWQVGILKKSIPLSLAVRGLMWGLPLAPVSIWAVFAFAIPFVITPYLVKKYWALMEFTRGAFVGSLLLLGR